MGNYTLVRIVTLFDGDKNTVECRQGQSPHDDALDRVLVHALWDIRDHVNGRHRGRMANLICLWDEQERIAGQDGYSAEENVVWAGLVQAAERLLDYWDARDAEGDTPCCTGNGG